MLALVSEALWYSIEYDIQKCIVAGVGVGSVLYAWLISKG